MAEDTGIQLQLNFKPDCLRFAGDCGGSAIKLVFAKELLEDQENKNCDKTWYSLEVASFSREELHEAGVFVKAYQPNVLIQDGPITPKMFATGVGANQFLERVNKSLKVDLQVQDELTMFVGTLRYLAATLPKQRFLHRVPPEIYDEIDQAFRATKRSHDAWSEKSDVVLPLAEYSLETNFWRRPEEPLDKDIPYAQAVGDSMYPCLMVPLGSCLLLVKVEASGKSHLVSYSARCGRMFLGLGQLLTGAKNFDELIELARRGDSTHLDQTMSDASGSASDSAYNEGLRHMKHNVLYSFGKAVGTSLGDWKKEDLARCLLRNALEDIAMETMHTAREFGIKRVFFVGSLTNMAFIRDEMTRAIGFYSVFHPKDAARYEFVRYGGYLGAIGALLQGCNNASGAEAKEEQAEAS